jgi:Golgi nucleoside diphosphatase
MLLISTGSNAITFHDAAIERGEKWITKAREYAMVKKSLKELQENERKLQAQLIELSEGVDSKGGGYIFTCTERKGSVQYKDIPELKGVNLEQFRGDSVNVWKIEMELK